MTLTKNSTDAPILCWPGRLLSADDLRRHLTSQREIVIAPNTIVTPLALDELRARRVAVRREASAKRPQQGTWGYAQECADAMVTSAIAGLEREGTALSVLPGSTARDWAQAVARSAHGGIVFCRDAALVCCVANKWKGLRAAVVANGKQTTQARLSLAANVLAVAVPGPTVFELRQIVKAALQPAACPDNVARILQELDGHAHR